MIESYEEELTVSSFSNDEKDLLIDYYENPPSDLKALIQARRNDHELDCCPYCGYPFAPDTLDHFIPKDSWPEFSFLANNLIPQCRGCAPIKGDSYYCKQSGGCFFIHPIFSDLISRVSIRILIAFDRESSRPTFTAQCCVADANQAEVARIARHMKQVKIKSRVENYCDREFSHLKRQLKKRHFNVRDMLEVSIRRKMDLNGPAIDWECALYQSIINDQLLIDFLHSFRPVRGHVADFPIVTELEIG